MCGTASFFIVDLLDLHAGRVCEPAAIHHRSLKTPPKTTDDYLDTLLKLAGNTAPFRR